MRKFLSQTAVLLALAISLAACTPAAPDPSYDSSGGWIGQICNSGSCEPVGFVLVDQGGSSSNLAGETIVTIDAEAASLGPLTGNRRGYRANWRTGDASAYFDVVGAFEPNNNFFAGRATLYASGYGAAISVDIRIEKIDDGLGSYSLRTASLPQAAKLGGLIAKLR